MPREIYHQFHGFISVDEATRWTPEIVEQRLIEAFEVELAMPGGGGGSSFWARAQHTQEDREGWDAESEFAAAQKRFERFANCPNQYQISRAEEASAWPLKYLQGKSRLQRNASRALLAWALCQASGASFAAVARARRWPERTAHRHRRIASKRISVGLEKDGIRLREAFTGDAARASHRQPN